MVALAAGFAPPALADDASAADDAPAAEAPLAAEPPHEPTPWLIDPAALRFEGLGLMWRLGAYAAVESTSRGGRTPHNREHDNAVTDARPIIDAWDEHITMHIEGDAIGVDTPNNLYEAWIGWQASRTAPRFSVGQFRVALGSEFGTHERDLPYIGYGFTSQFDGRYDVGARVDGTLTEGVWYQAAAVAGQGFNLEGERLGSPQASLRVEIAPFRMGDPGAESAGGLQGFRVGLAHAVRGSGKDHITRTTPLESPLFDSGKIHADGGRWTHLDIGWASGPFQLGFEKVIGTLDGAENPAGVPHDYDGLNAYSWFAAWNLTGEESGWRDGTWATGPCPGPRTCSFLPQGRWEAAFRFSTATFGRGFFNDGITAYDGSGTWQAMTYSAAVFWEPTHNTRIGFECLWSVTEDPMARFANTKRDTTYALRLELKF